MARQRLRDLLTDTRATVALETALLLPIMLLLMVGSWETYAYMRAYGTIDRVAYTVGDIVARKSRLIDDASTSDGDNIGAYYEAAVEIARPLDLEANGGLILSAIHKDAGTAPGLSWQEVAPYTGDTFTSAIGEGNLTAVLGTEAESTLTLRTDETLIVAEVFYTFQPFLWSRAVWHDAPLQVTLYRRTVYLARYDGLETLADPDETTGGGGSGGSAGS